MKQLVSGLIEECKHASRRVLKSPVFAAISILTIALGVGVNSAIFSVVNTIAFENLPFKDADRLVFISSSHPGNNAGGNSISQREIIDISERTQTFEWATPVLDWLNVTLVSGESANSVRASFVDSEYFTYLNISTLLGRAFTGEENRIGAARKVALISESLWRTQFAADEDIIGRVVRVNDIAMIIIGVMPDSTSEVNDAWSSGSDVWLPMNLLNEVMGGNYLDNRRAKMMVGLALLAPELSVKAAQDEMNSIAAALAEEFPDTQEGYGIHIEPIRAFFYGDLQRPVWLVWSAAALVLLIASANLAGLLLVRGWRRRSEIAARVALGSSRLRITSMLLAEPLIVGIGGLIVGLLLGEFIVDWFVRSEAVHFPAFVTFGVNFKVFAVSAALTFLIIFIFALIPARVANRINVAEVLSASGTGRVVHSAAKGQKSLVVGEIALAMSLLVVAVFTISSFVNLQNTVVGYESDNLLTMRFDLRSQSYQDPVTRLQFSQQLQAKLNADPDIDDAIMWGANMLGRGYIGAALQASDYPVQSPKDLIQAGRHNVSPGGLALLGIPLQTGREFSEQDTMNQPNVTILSETMAARLWPNENALGNRIRFNDQDYEVVGVARDALHRPRFIGNDQIYADGGKRDIYLPYWQHPPRRAVLLLRTRSDANQIVERVYDAVRQIDPDVPIYDIDMMTHRLQIDDALNAFLGKMLGLFAIIAVFLSVVGIYGLLQFAVQQREKEFGIRISVGARQADIMRLIVQYTATLSITGVLIGLLGAGLFSMFVESLLYEVDQYEWRVFALAGIIIVGIALLAGLVPAVRAANTDPAQTLRSD